MVAAGRKSMDFDTITGAGPTLIAVPSLPAAGPACGRRSSVVLSGGQRPALPKGGNRPHAVHADAWWSGCAE